MKRRPLFWMTTALALGTQACTCHSTAANEIGVMTKKVAVFGKRGVQDTIYAPGATYFFVPFTTDWHTFETKLQNLRMTQESKDDLEFKTVDGNDVSVDVIVAWRVDPAKAPRLLQRVGPSTDFVEDRLVRPAARAFVRDALNRLRSEDFYVADRRFAAAEEGRRLMSEGLGEEGVLVEQVILGEHRFNPQYEQVIRDKKLAEQTAEKLKSETQAALEEAKRNLETARGRVAQRIAEATGGLERAKLAAAASLVQSANEAEAILIEAKANAEAIEKRNAAMSGAGGKTMVKLRIAEALAGKRILLVPGGKSGAAVQTLNVNKLVDQLVAKGATDEAAQSSSAP